MKKTFENCTWSELNKWFDLTKHKGNDFSYLQNLLDASINISNPIQSALHKLHQNLIDNFMDWNEDELKMQFIAPLLYLVDYTDSPKYHPFSQRSLQFQIDDIELAGVVDWILASGKQFPEEPYFFLHEYKKEKGSNNDPLGQILAAMITAQYLSTDKERIIYGAYIVGKDWYFVALKGNEYANSLPYSTTDLTVLKKLYAILTHLKSLIV